MLHQDIVRDGACHDAITAELHLGVAAGSGSGCQVEVVEAGSFGGEYPCDIVVGKPLVDLDVVKLNMARASGG